MPRFPKRTSRGLRHAAATAVALTLTAASATACSGSGDDAAASVPHLNAQQEIGPAEGSLDLVVWAGYAEDGTNDKTADWVTPFEKASGCQVNAKIADTSDSMVALMKTG